MIDDMFDIWSKPRSESKVVGSTTTIGITANNATFDNVSVKKGITLNDIPVMTQKDVNKLKEELENQKSLIDIQTDAFAYLLRDKIKEEFEQIKKEDKRRIKKDKIKTINNFTKAINKVIFTKKNETIVLWKDGTKTKVTCQEGDEFDKEKGLALCIIKYIFGNITEFNNIFKAFDFDSNESQIEPNTK